MADSTTFNLREMIRSMIAETVEETLKDVMNELSIDAKVAEANRTERLNDMPANIDRERRGPIRRRRGKVGPSKVYSVNVDRRSLDRIAETLNPQRAKVLRFIGQHPAVSAPRIESGTGLKRKSVESCVWYLRRHDASERLVRDGRGLIVSEAAE